MDQGIDILQMDASMEMPVYETSGNVPVAQMTPVQALPLMDSAPAHLSLSNPGQGDLNVLSLEGFRPGASKPKKNKGPVYKGLAFTFALF